jgi:dienelactone hydrolase
MMRTARLRTTRGRGLGTGLGLLAAMVFLGQPGRVRAEIKSQEIDYKAGDTPLSGFLAYDDAAKGKRPGILVVHEWWGHNQHARDQALRLAKAGYVAFALDMYGKGKLATHPKDATAFMEAVMKDQKVVAARFDAALEILKKQPQVNPAKIGAFGYCFGGAVALIRARAGEDLRAVVTFHGNLSAGAGTAQKGQVKARILVQTGEADPFVPKEQVEAFKKEMKDAGAKVEVITYPGAKHSFTNPDAGKAGMDAMAYDADADKKSWDAALKFLKPAFAK